MRGIRIRWRTPYQVENAENKSRKRTSLCRSGTSTRAAFTVEKHREATVRAHGERGTRRRRGTTADGGCARWIFLEGREGRRKGRKSEEGTRHRYEIVVTTRLRTCTFLRTAPTPYVVGNVEYSKAVKLRETCLWSWDETATNVPRKTIPRGI